MAVDGITDWVDGKKWVHLVSLRLDGDIVTNKGKGVKEEERNEVNEHDDDIARQDCL